MRMYPVLSQAPLLEDVWGSAFIGMAIDGGEWSALGYILNKFD